MSKQVQPKYQLLVNGVDVTDDSKSDVVFVSEPNNISTLSFTLSGKQYAMTSADIIKIGDRVEFYGGTFGKSLIYPALDNYKLFFYGNVKSLQPEYADTGLVSVQVEAVDVGYSSMKQKRKFIYPTKYSNERTWANVPSISARDIIFNIVERELNLKVGKFEVPNASSVIYTYKQPISQQGINDWKFIQKIASLLGFDVLTRVDSYGDTFLDFIDKGIQKKSNDNKVRFVYPLRENKLDKNTPNANSFKYQEINNIQGIVDIVAMSVSLNQDLSRFFATRRTVEVYDKVSGTSINVIQTFDEITPQQREENTKAKALGKPAPYQVTLVEDGKEFIDAYYRMEVDESKLPSDEKKREELKEIALKVASQDSKTEDSNFSFQDIKQYFKRAEFLDPRVSVIDQPYVGIDVNVTIEGEVYLQNTRSYPILGIQRYGSSNLNDSYHLVTLTHRWGDDGYLCDLQFKL